MNLSRGWLTEGKPRCLAPACPTVSASLRVSTSLLRVSATLGLSASLWLALCAPLPAHADEDRGGQAAEADVLPGADEKAAPDLQLHGDAATKADALSSFGQAILAEDNADSDTALASYKKALSLDPGYTELAVKVAFEMARRGDASGGIQVLKDSIKASPNAPLAYLYLSQLYANFLDKPDVGLKYALQALDLDPANLASYLAVCQIYKTLGQDAKVSEFLDLASKQNSSDPQYWLGLGDNLLKSFGTAVLPPEQIKKVNAVYARALALDGDNAATLAHVADFYTGSGQQKDAIPLYLRAIKLSPANASDGDDTLGSIRNNLAVCFDAVGKTPEAIATLKQLIKDDPLRYESYGALCDLYEKTGDNEAALGLCKQMMLMDQTDFRNYVRAAALLMKEKKTDAAVQMLTDARVKFPNESQVSYSLGLALSEAKRYPEALTVFDETAQEASEGQTDMLDAEFYFAYGAAAEQAGQVDKAEQLLKKSIDLDPQNGAEAYNYIGFMWVDRGLKLDEGAELIKKALAADPENPAYIDSLGWYYFKKGDYAQAVTLLKKAAGLIQPEDAVVDEHLGDAYSASNDTPNALEYWQRASNIDKENKEIAVKIAGARQKLARQGTTNAPPPQ